MSKSELSFSEFQSRTKDEWKAQIERELKGAAYSSLTTELEEGIHLQPVYTAEDTADVHFSSTRSQAHVDLIEAVEVNTGKEANPVLLDLLNRGCSGLILYLQKGVILKDLLKDVLIQHITIHYVSDGEALSTAKQLIDLIKERGLDPKEIRGSVNADPIENLARTGNWFQSEDRDFETLKNLLELNLPQVRTLCVNANLYHNAGAQTSTELAIALAHAHEYIVKFGAENAHKIWMNLAIGRNYLLQVAKFRAVRQLWNTLVGEYRSSSSDLHIYAETGLRNKTIFDPNVNMLRTTTEGMSALVGGVDEISIYPFDVCYRSASPLSQRVARNQALVMQYEAFAAKVNDPSAGAYAIEKLTSDLCEKAWKTFQEIEAEGGLIASLKSGFIQERIEREAEREQEEFDQGKLTLVGTNKFPNADELMSDKAEYTLFHSPSREGKYVRKVTAVRLSEKLERERLNSENS